MSGRRRLRGDGPVLAAGPRPLRVRRGPAARQPAGRQAAALPARARSVIFLFMVGGPSHIDLFDPKPELTEAPRQAAAGQLRQARQPVHQGRHAAAGQHAHVQEARPVRPRSLRPDAAPGRLRRTTSPFCDPAGAPAPSTPRPCTSCTAAGP